jgi:putative ubiquitin-RnfH superfamily antitoxin RatB of RatAB toxin-antitoxin module
VPAERIRVEVVWCPRPRACERVLLELGTPATLADALRASGLVQRHGWDPETLQVGIWGRAQPLQAPLRDQDRVEIYRPLVVDPKEARRLRYRRQRESTSG